MKIIISLTLLLSGCAAFRPPPDMSYEQRLAVMQALQNHPQYQQQFYSPQPKQQITLTCQHYNAQTETCVSQ